MESQTDLRCLAHQLNITLEPSDFDTLIRWALEGQFLGLPGGPNKGRWVLKGGPAKLVTCWDLQHCQSLWHSLCTAGSASDLGPSNTLAGQREAFQLIRYVCF
jgi:hypothetical protein